MLIRGREKTSKDSKEKYYEILKQQKVSSSVRKPFMPSLIFPILQCHQPNSKYRKVQDQFYWNQIITFYLFQIYTVNMAANHLN